MWRKGTVAFLYDFQAPTHYLPSEYFRLKKKRKFVSGRSNIVVHCVNGEEVGYGTFASLPGVIKRNSSSKQFSIECWKLSGIVLFFALWLVQKNSCPFLNQSDAKLKLIMTWSSAFSRALGSLFVFTFEFSLALKGIFLTSNRPLWLLWQFYFFSSHFRVGMHWYCKEKFLFAFLWE